MVAEAPPMSAKRTSPPLGEVLVIDANEDHLTLSAIALGRRGFKVTAVASGKEGLRLALSQAFDAIILDHKVRDLSAFEVLKGLVGRLPHTPKIFVVASGTEDQAVKALGAGATGYLVKTARYNEVLPMEVEDQIEKARIKVRVQEQGRALAAGIEERRRLEETMRDFEERIGLMSKHAPFILWTLDMDLRFTSSVGSGLARIGLRPNQVNGLTLQEFAQTDDPDMPMVAAHRRALQGEASRFEQEWHERIFDVHVEPLREKDGPVLGVFGIALDITERVRAERVQSALYRITQAASTAENLHELFRSIHGIVGELMPAKNFYIALHEPGADSLTFPYFVDEEEDPPGPQPLGRGLTEYVLRTGKPLLATPEAFGELLRAGEVEQIGPNSIDWLGVPLAVKDRIFGVLVVQSYEEGVRYREEEKDLLRFVSSQIAMVIDRRRAEESLRESERVLSSLIGSLPGVAYRTRNDENWTNEFVSEGCLELLGYQPEDLIGSRRICGRDLIHPDDRGWVLQETEAAVRERRPYRLSYRIRTASGEEKWVWDQGHAVYGPDGQVLGLEGLTTDVTEWKGAVESLKSMAVFRALFDSANDAILLVDRAGKILDANPMAEAFLARERGELVGRPVTDVVPPSPSGPFPRRLGDLFEDRLKGGLQDTTVLEADGRRRPVSLQARLVREAGADPMAELSLRDAEPAPAKRDSEAESRPRGT